MHRNYKENQIYFERENNNLNIEKNDYEEEDEASNVADEAEITEYDEQKEENKISKSKFSNEECSHLFKKQSSAFRSFYDNLSFNKSESQQVQSECINQKVKESVKNSENKSIAINEQMSLVTEVELNLNESINNKKSLKQTSKSFLNKTETNSPATQDKVTRFIPSLPTSFNNKQMNQTSESSGTCSSSSSACSLSQSLEYCDLDSLNNNNSNVNNNINDEMNLVKATENEKTSENVEKNNENKFGTCEKLKLQSIVEAVGFIMFPSNGFMSLALNDLFIENDLQEIYK